MENMNYNFELDENVNMESLKILINQCWKLLPIYEGKSKDNNIVNSKEQAYENYQKHLTFLITKVSGASKIWKNNQYYIELLYILVGMKDKNNFEYPTPTHGEGLKPLVTLEDAIGDLPQIKSGQTNNSFNSNISNDFLSFVRNSTNTITEHSAPNNGEHLIKIMESLMIY